MTPEFQSVTHSRKWTVAPAMTTHRGGHDILSSPALIQCIETTAKELLAPLLPDGWDSVGTYVEFRHLGPTPLGAEFEVHVQTAGSNGGKPEFTCRVADAVGTVAEARHDRRLIDLERYGKRLSQQLADPMRQMHMAAAPMTQNLGEANA